LRVVGWEGNGGKDPGKPINANLQLFVSRTPASAMGQVFLFCGFKEATGAYKGGVAVGGKLVREAGENVVTGAFGRDVKTRGENGCEFKWKTKCSKNPCRQGYFHRKNLHNHRKEGCL